MSKKPTINFSDLGLTTPLPDVLSKSREDRRKEKIQKKKETKTQINEALGTVAESRTLVDKHRQFVLDEKEEEKMEKEKRKKELKVLHILSQRTREDERKEKERRSVQSQKELCETLRQEHKAKIQSAQTQILATFEEKMKLGKEAPNSVHIAIHRTEKIEEQRKGLPVLQEEQVIVENITETKRTCVLLCGETGSGKTTQVPQFLWEAGYGHAEGASLGRAGSILVTEPRRVAAISMAQRVAEELNVTFGQEVGYHVRYDNNISNSCKIKFATEGIVLKEIQSDFLLNKYSVIIIDEAHERSVSCDILIGLLSRIVPLRNDLFNEELEKCGGDITQTKIKPLRLVIMSATMRVMDFRDNTKLFPVTPPLINVDSRRYPVTNHFTRKTVLKDYVTEAFKKVCQMHRKLPPGGILVFLCTQYEIEDLCQRLADYHARTKVEYYDDSYSKHALLTGKEEGEEDEEENGKSTAIDQKNEEKDEYGLRDADYALAEDDSTEKSGVFETASTRDNRKRSRVSNPDDQEQEMDDFSSNPKPNGGDDDEVGEVNGELDTLHILPLYALLDQHKQKEVFKKPPKNKRLCVVATNVAETSITIPNIRYVVDLGRVKSRVLDKDTQASCYKIDWISQASAEQRSGRAGRMGPGHCYRLYSTAVYSNVMSTHSVPEILRTPLESVTLLMKHIGIEHVSAFPFPSPPSAEDVQKSLVHLQTIGALSRDFSITPLGKQLTLFPVLPRFARAIVEAEERLQNSERRDALLDMVKAVVAVTSTTSTIFTSEGNQLKLIKPNVDESLNDPRSSFIREILNPGSDLITNLNAFRRFMNNPWNACRDLCLVQKSMNEAKMLYFQLCNLSIGQMSGSDLIETLDAEEFRVKKSAGKVEEAVLTRNDEVILRQVFIPGFMDQIARRATPQECIDFKEAYNDKKTSKSPYVILSSKTIAYVHPSSSIGKTYPPPEYVTFSYLQKVSRSASKKPLTHMLGVTIVMKEWLTKAGFEESL